MILVDGISYTFGRMRMCHMVSTESVEELHAFARALGLRRNWFQFRSDRRHSVPHYDVCISKRLRAMTLGAVAVSARDLARRAHRPDGPPSYLQSRRKNNP